MRYFKGMNELTVIFKASGKRKHEQSFPMYERYEADADDEKVALCIETARKSISWKPERTSLNIKIEVPE